MTFTVAGFALKMIGYLPWLQEILRPVLEAKGAKAKAEVPKKMPRKGKASSRRR